MSNGRFGTFIVSLTLLVTACAAFVPSEYLESFDIEPPKITGFDSPVITVTGPRPLLVVLLEYSDLPANVDASTIHEQIFGPRPSMNDYFNESSYDNFWFSDMGHFEWVTAWDDPLTPEDESTRTYWDDFGPSDTYKGGTRYMHGLISLDEAGYDFAPLDVNDDDEIQMGSELAYLMLDSQYEGNRGGATRNMPPTTLDGKDITGRAAAVREESPWITLYAHELGHQALSLPDYYAIKPKAIGYFSLMGYSGTGGWNAPRGPVHLDPYSKLKLGWYSPTVVNSDGFFDIPNAGESPVAFILHDPAHGTDEYFMVENRWRGDSYDNASGLIPQLEEPLPPADPTVDIPDQGLLVWHVDETRNWDGTTSGGFPKVNLTRRGTVDWKAAFDGSDWDYYDLFDGSTPHDAKWNDGTDSKTGVWCASEAQSTMRAWLDVPGPGILVCPIVDSGSAIPGSVQTYEVKLVNTGDVSDTFQLSVVYADVDLTATFSPIVTLDSKESATKEIQITPYRDCMTSPGTRHFKIRAESTSDPSIWTEIEATIEVLPFGEPQVSIPVDFEDVYPDSTATYTIELENRGNVPDTYTLSFTGVDFGDDYLAYPTAIPSSWVTFNPENPSIDECGSDTVVMEIAVPHDWAAMEDATYEWYVDAQSSITSDIGTAGGELLIYATPESMMFWVLAEVEALLADVDALPPSDVRDGLRDKAEAALNKVSQSLDEYMADDDPPASNHFKTTINILSAFINQLNAQSGKMLTAEQASDFEAQVNLIIEHINAILSEIS